MFIVCFCVTVSPAQACSMTGEAQALTAEQIPRHQGRQAQQCTLAAFSNKHCSLLFHVWRAFSLKLAMEEPALLEKQDYKGALRCPAQQKKGFSLPWPSLKALLLTPPTRIAPSRYINQGTKWGRVKLFQPGLP